MSKRLPVAEDLWQLKWVSDVAVHPSGSEIVYAVSHADRRTNREQSSLWRVKDGSPPQRFTAGDSDSAPVYRPDGRELAFLSRRSGSRQVWLMPADGGEARQLTRIEGGVSECAWSPDGKRMAIVCGAGPQGLEVEQAAAERTAAESAHPERQFTRDVKIITELFHKLDGDGYFGERRPKLGLIERVSASGEDAQEDKAVRLLTDGPYPVQDISFTPDGGGILFLSRRQEDYDRRPEEWQLYRIDLGDGEVGPVQALSPGNNFSVLTARMSPDGRTIALLATRPADLGYDNVGLYLRAEDGTLTRLGEALDRPFADLGISDVMAKGYAGVTWGSDGRTVLTLFSDCGRVHLVAVDTVLKSVRTLAGGDRRIAGYAATADLRTIALSVTDPVTPSRLTVWRSEDGEERTLDEPSRSFTDEVAVLAPVPFTARAEQGPDLDGFLLLPDSPDGSRVPTVLEIHGGPMMMYAWSFFFEFQVLAGRGYAVVFGNPRGSQGYGEGFCSAIRDQWGDLDYADVMAILDEALRMEPKLDSQALGVAGGSYGGYMTNWIVGHTERFKAAATMRSVADWRAMMGTSDVGPEWVHRAGGEPPWTNDPWYVQQSPITYVDRIVTPLLIEHQEGDLRCPIEQAEILFTAVKWLGKAPVKFVRYPDEFHGMSRNGKPWHRVHRLQLLTDWFDRYLRGREGDVAFESSAERSLASSRTRLSVNHGG